MAFIDTLKSRASATAQKTLGVNSNSTTNAKTTGKTITQILTQGKDTTGTSSSKTSSKSDVDLSVEKPSKVTKRRTSTKKKASSVKTTEPSTSITKSVKDAYKSTKESDRETRKKAIKKAASDAFQNKKKKLGESFVSHAEKTIDGGVEMMLQNAHLQWATKKVGEMALLSTIMAIDAAGGDPLYKSGYCIKEFLKRDYESIISYLVEKHKYSVINGKEASYFNATKYGATRCSIYILKKKREIKGDKWYQENRYSEIKKIILKCYTNFMASDIMSLMSSGGTLIPENPFKLISNGNPSETKTTYKRKVLPSGYGDNGCDEFKTKYRFTTAEVNRIFPEKKTAHGIPVTYPKTVEHYTLFKALMSKMVYGDDRLIHELLDVRVNKNLVYTPLTKEMIDMADEVMKETGMDQVINAVQNKNMAMYMYVKWLIDEKYI